MHRSKLIIDRSAIRTNIERLQSRLGAGCKIMAMVKADGYGVGAVRVATTAWEAGVKWVGVATLSEAIELQEADYPGEILLLHTTTAEVEEAVSRRITLALSSADMIQRVSKIGPSSIHLNINTGMNRLGCRPEEATALARQIESTPNLTLDGVMSHLSAADDPASDEWTRTQAALFEAIPLKTRYRHLANSAGAIRFAFPSCNLARIGLALYGLTPSEEVATALPLEPALTLTSTLVEIRDCREGEAISYNRHYRVGSGGARIGVLPIGYADGLHGRYRDRDVTLHGKRCPIVGSICMDFTMIDLRGVPEAAIGDEAILFGRGGALAHDFATGSIYELITCLGKRIKRTEIA